MESFADACDMPFASIPEDPAALVEILSMPQEGPRFLEVQVR
jgi:hypothetical protein